MHVPECGTYRRPDGRTRAGQDRPGVFQGAGTADTRAAGLYMQSRFPNPGWENGVTAGPYSVFHGFNDLFQDFEAWLARRLGRRCMPTCSRPPGAFGGSDVFGGGLSASAKLRDYNPRGIPDQPDLEHPRRAAGVHVRTAGQPKRPGVFMANDDNAQISVITGAWAVRLFASNRNFSHIRSEAARAAADGSRVHRDPARPQPPRRHPYLDAGRFPRRADGKPARHPRRHGGCAHPATDRSAAHGRSAGFPAVSAEPPKTRG
jgi:hypothetical protein